MTTLRVVVDELVADSPGGLGRYAEELTRQLILTAPPGCEVEGLASALQPAIVTDLSGRLPGITGITRLPLRRRELSLAWQSGIAVPRSGGMLHAPSLFAPLARHDRLNNGDQITVTIHDVLPWTSPESLSPATVVWHKTMVRRARRYADAVVVPTHAVAEQLSEIIDLGDRVRVIGGAPAPSLRLPADADARAARLDLPPHFVFTMGSIAPRKGVADLIKAMAFPGVHGLPLLIAGPDRFGEGSASGVAAAAGLPEGRIRPMGHLDDDDLAVILSRATVFVFPSRAEGFGLPIVEAFKFGLPVIHSDDPAILEVSGGAGMAVERDGTGTYAERLAEAVAAVLDDTELRSRLAVHSADRARAFSWRDSAERVWQLHADL